MERLLSANQTDMTQGKFFFEIDGENFSFFYRFIREFFRQKSQSQIIFYHGKNLLRGGSDDVRLQTLVVSGKEIV